MLQRLSIRGKILAVVAVPILVLIFGAGFVVWNSVNDVSRSQNAVSLMLVVERGQDYTAAFRAEADAATNYVDAWTEGRDQLANRVESLNTALASLEALAESDGAAAAALEQVNAILAGGQPIVYVRPGTDSSVDSTAMSLEQMRSVRPAANPETGILDWPSEEDVARLSSSYTALANALTAYIGTLPAGESVQLAVQDVHTYTVQEGNRATIWLTETPVFQAEFLAAQPAVDTAWATMNAAINDLPPIENNATVVAILREVQRTMNLLPERRTDILSRSVGPNPTLTYYHGALGNTTRAIEEIALVVDDSVLSRRLEAYVATEALINEMAREDTSVDMILRAGRFAQGTATAIRTQFARTDFMREQARAALANLNMGFNLPNTGASFDSGSQAAYESVRNRVSDSTGLQLATAARQDWPTQVREELSVLYPFADDTLELSKAQANQTLRDAIVRAIVTVVASIVIVAASLILALLIARRIVNPLRRLTTTATAVRQELPRLVERVALPGEKVDVSEVQIPVESQDEVGRLAEAFNSVNAATLAIASEQAALRGSISEMFVNVARRDQVLLNRQLASIDEMERTEDDPETLTKLFALDHLATRMRRNSESLLVLAGIDTGRRLRRPMPLSDVIRTASSEIELYERVQLELDADPPMVGHSALTAAHLFAELLENATVFSDPGTPVIVRTAQEGTNYVVRISDSGIGMTPEELAEANSRVASSAASEILGAQRLGLFVVGRIARRIGARVEITSQEGEGTVATVYLPPSLFDLSASTDYSPATAADESGAFRPLTKPDIKDEVLETSSAVASATERAGVANLQAYQPAVIVDGPSLTGRNADSPSTEDLVAADAAQAPEAQPVDLEALTEGVTPAGLPTRRRGSKAKGKEAKSETDSIIGLPAQATDAQLSALEASAGSGFTPVVAASEVSPQTAEQRAAMFRGFRSRREDAAAAAPLPPDAESLGQAVRRGAAVPPQDVEGAAAAAAVAFDDDIDGDTVPTGAFAPAAAEPEPAAAPAPARQDPLIRHGYEHDDYGGTVPVATSAAPFAIPAFEEDEEPYTPPIVATTPLVQDDAPQFAEELLAAAPAVPVEGAVEAPVQQHAPAASFEAAPAVEQGFAPAEQSLPAEQGVGPVERASAFPSPVAAPQTGGIPAQTGGFPAVQPGADAGIVSTPSLDELIRGGQEPKSGGFFSKLFRKKGGAKDEPSPATALLSSIPQGPGTGGVPVVPGAVPTPGSGIPVPTPGSGIAVPTPGAGFPVPAADASAPSSDTVPVFVPSADGTELDQYEPSGDYRGPRDAWNSEVPAEAPALTPAAAAEPYNPGALGGTPPLYTRDDLARPVGWETAGESALAAAAPEVVSTYTPAVVQLDPEPAAYDDDADLASAVFNEFSSLTSERPKVEKTRAGLTKRQRQEVAPPPEPIEEELAIAHVERDPEEIRARFSNFYSGTQRARHDVEAFEQQTSAFEAQS